MMLNYPPAPKGNTEYIASQSFDIYDITNPELPKDGRF